MAIVYGTNASNVISWGFPPFLKGTTNGADTVYGLGGDDEIYGHGGNDTLVGGAGADDLDGGTGIDTASYEDSLEGVQVGLAAGVAFFGTAQGDSLISIENLTGSAHGDWLDGDAGGNVLRGNDGGDLLQGRGGDDILNGDAGNDYMDGGAGADILDGGVGIDTATYTVSSAAVAISLITDAAGGGDAEGDDLNNIENVIGSQYDDTIVGDDGANVLDGRDGADVLKGYGGADRLDGDDGADQLLGMDGTDHLYGGVGRDMLAGGADGDVFEFDSVDETGVTIPTMDRISDFNFAEGDRIDLHVIDADVYAAGNQAFTFIGNAAFSGTPGEINYYHSGGETIIQMQTGVDVDIEGGIRLSGIYTPDVSWFVL